MFTLINNEALKIELDPVETEDKYRPSAAFNISVMWKTIFHITKIEIRENWFEYEDLNKFQANLQMFVESKINAVNLCDMGLNPLLEISRVNQDIYFELKIASNLPMGKASLKTEIEKEEPNLILERMRGWEK